jgi:uncharacterized protein (TIGR02996 family)
MKLNYKLIHRAAHFLYYRNRNLWDSLSPVPSRVVSAYGHFAGDASVSILPPLYFDGSTPERAALWWKFSIEMPGGVVDCFRLIRALRARPARGDGDPFLSRAFNSMTARLYRDLGFLPAETESLYELPEFPFWQSIWDDPGDLASWHAYSDWLQEHDEPRGLVIASWLGAVKKTRRVRT